jgi:hypothetical protein
MANEPNDERKSRVVPVVMDVDTGELRAMTPDDVVEEVKPKAPKGKAKNEENGGVIPPKTHNLYFRVYKTNWADLVLKSGLSFSQLGLLVALMAYADWGTNRLVHPETKQLLSINALAELWNKNRKHLSESLYDLEDKGLISLVGHGASKYILVNAQVLWFGKFMSNIKEHVEQFKDAEYKPVVTVGYREPPQK